MKKSIVIIVLLGMMSLSGCASKDVAQQSEQETTMVTEATTVTETTTVAETTTVTETTTVAETTTVSEENETITYNSFLSEYKEDLDNIHIMADAYNGSELIERDEALEITTVIVTKDYYFDTEVIENAKAGDIIQIQGVGYELASIQLESEGWYSVEVLLPESEEIPEGQYLYSDIYGFGKTKDGKHYIAYFCSDDIIQEEIYNGAVFFDKECLVGLYEKDELLKEYFQQEYSFINSIGCEVNEEGLIQYFYNQIAG